MPLYCLMGFVIFATAPLILLLNGTKKDTSNLRHCKVKLLKKLVGDKTKPMPESVILIENGRTYDRSSAALRIAKKLNGLWPLLYIFIIVPKPIRDAVYNLIGRNRYKWFGKTEACMIPTPEVRSRFLDTN